jgi:hypothetical protein
MRWYRALLRVYPRSFRDEYGAEMDGIFRVRRRQSSGLAVVGLWAEAITDALVNGARTHWSQLAQDLRYSLRSLSQARGSRLPPWSWPRSALAQRRPRSRSPITF